MSKFGVFPEKTSRELLVEAYLELKTSIDKGIDMKNIDALYIGNFSSDLFEGQCHLAPIMSEWLGLVPKPATRVEDACASGGVAIREGMIAVASGIYDLVLVCGVEKMTNLPTERVTDTLAAAGDTLYEVPSGLTFPGLYALMATAYLEKYKITTQPLLSVGIKNHHNGALNPKAQFNTSIKDIIRKKQEKAKQKGIALSWKDEFEFLNDSQANPIVAWPLRLFDCAPISDGAACILLAAEEIAERFTEKPVYIIGSGQASDCVLHSREDLTTIRAAKVAAKQAYQSAKVNPSDIQLAEVHDCFTIAEIIASEDLGFFKPGYGAKAALEGLTSLTGEKPINTSGGLKAKGHPIGASGVAQAVEIWKQLRGEANKRQVPNVRLGLTHNVGATGGTCVVHIYERG
jgi:acetyl-CoA C-acetyltransferase